MRALMEGCVMFLRYAGSGAHGKTSEFSCSLSGLQGSVLIGFWTIKPASVV